MKVAFTAMTDSLWLICFGWLVQIIVLTQEHAADIRMLLFAPRQAISTALSVSPPPTHLTTSSYFIELLSLVTRTETETGWGTAKYNSEQVGVQSCRMENIHPPCL